MPNRRRIPPVIRDRIACHYLPPKALPFLPQLRPHCEGDKGCNHQRHGAAFQERKGNEIRVGNTTVYVAAQEVFQFGGMAPLRSRLLQPAPAFIECGRREANGRVSSPSGGHIGRYCRLARASGSGLHQPSDFGRRTCLFRSLAALPICGQIVALKRLNLPYKPSCERQYRHTQEHGQKRRSSPRKCTAKPLQSHGYFSPDSGAVWRCFLASNSSAF